MFLEIKDFEMVNLNEIASFYLYPYNENEYVRRSLYIKLRGTEDSRKFTFETSRQAHSAYRRLIRALRKNQIEVEEIDCDDRDCE